MFMWDSRDFFLFSCVVLLDFVVCLLYFVVCLLYFVVCLLYFVVCLFAIFCCLFAIFCCLFAIYIFVLYPETSNDPCNVRHHLSEEKKKRKKKKKKKKRKEKKERRIIIRRRLQRFSPFQLYFEKKDVIAIECFAIRQSEPSWLGISRDSTLLWNTHGRVLQNKQRVLWMQCELSECLLV